MMIWPPSVALRLVTARAALVVAAFFSFGVCVCTLSSCASYQLGSGTRALPGGYELVAVPVFANNTNESGIEVGFTNALIGEFEKSRAAQVTSQPQAQVVVRGTVDSVVYNPTGTTSSNISPYLPPQTSLNSSYRIFISATVELVRASDLKPLFVGHFQGERPYLAPLVTLEGLNSVDPLYNQSAREGAIAKIAKDMMWEAHNQMTESF